MSMGRPTKVDLRNLSRSGFQTEWLYPLALGERIWLTIGNIRAMPAAVAWTEGFTIGCRFEEPLHPAVLTGILKQARGTPADPT